MSGDHKRNKICLISSSGGHYEQLRMLAPLGDNHEVFWVTEDADYDSKADYYLLQTGLKDWRFPFRMLVNLFKSIRIWRKERPDCIISTGTMIVLPMALLAKIFGKKIIYIESFAKVYDGNRAGKLMYHVADLFIIQWESLRAVYPNAVYGGSIY